VIWEISRCNFYNINSHCLGFKDSTLDLQYSTFNNSALVNDSNSIRALNADDHINGVSWILADGGIEGGTFSINLCEFIENKIAPNFGGAIRFTGLFVIRYSFTDNRMIKNCALYGGAIYSENPFLLIDVREGFFINNTAKYGGAIYKKSPSSRYPMYKIGTLLILDATFLGNKADIKGGSIFAHKENIIMARVLFKRNQAKYGGAIYYAETQNVTFLDALGVNDIIFDSNSAQDFGAEMDHYTSINNKDPKNQTILAVKIASSRFSFYNITSEEKKILDNDDNLHEWVKNQTKTVKIFYE